MSRLVCPAAADLAGAVGAPSVLCGALHRANAGAHVRGNTARGHVSPVMDGDSDRTAIGAYCMGPGIPGAINSYCSCPIWRAAREAEWAQRNGPDALRDELAERPPAIDPELREFVSAGSVSAGTFEG